MPTYSFKNNDTGAEWEEFFSIADKAEMKENECEILNRDLLHFHFSNEHYFGKLTTTNDQSLRIMLIGKDGGIKYESSRSVSILRFFELIDSMPMRQDEMVHDRC